MQLHGFKYLAKLLMSFLLGKSQVLVPNTVEIDGGNNLITNAVVVARNTNQVYYTASSTKFDLTNAMYEALTKGSGRLYKYDMKTNSNVLSHPNAGRFFLKFTSIYSLTRVYL